MEKGGEGRKSQGFEASKKKERENRRASIMLTLTPGRELNSCLVPLELFAPQSA